MQTHDLQPCSIVHQPSTLPRAPHDGRQIEIHTAEPLVPEPTPFEAEIGIVKLTE
jgi:hypothetical protein